MDNQKYILAFNFEEVSSQVDSVAKSYTDLGSTIRGMSNKAAEDVEALKLKVASVTSTLNLMTTSLDQAFASLRGHLGTTATLLDDIAKHSKTISENFANIPKAFPAAGMDPTKDTAHERIKDVVPQGVSGVAKPDKDSGEEEKDEDKENKEDEEKAKKAAEKKHNMFVDLIEKEVRGAKSGVGSVISKASMGVLGGGLIGGAITAMIMGYSEKARKQAESGEMLNVLEATGEKLFTGPIQKANKWFSNFQEKAQFYYGIGRKEIQGVMKQMVDSGYSATEMMERYDKKLGEVGRNTTTLTLGLDKHLNLASGTSMQNVMKLTSEYGDTLKDAADNIVNLSRTAQQSGAGINRFIDSVMSGSAALTQYGIDLKDVVSLTSELEKHYTAMGLDKRYAGQLATSAMQGITSGISGFSNEMKAALGVRMDPSKTGFGAIQSFEEGWQAVKSGEDKGRMIRVMEAMRQLQNEQVGGADRSVQIQFWKQQGLSGAGATAFVDEAAKGSFDRLNASTEESNKTWKGLKEAFKTEGEQVSELQKDQRDIINGLAAAGQGLLQILGGLIGVIVTGIRSLPALVAWAVEMINPKGDKAKANRIMDAIIETQNKQFDAISAGMDKFGEAGAHLKDTAYEKIFKVLGSNVKAAATGDLSGTPKGQEAETAARESAEEQEDFAFQRGLAAGAFKVLDAITPGETGWADMARDQEMKGKSNTEEAARQRKLAEQAQNDRNLKTSGRAGPYARLSQDEAAYEAAYLATIPMAVNISGEEVLAMGGAAASAKQESPR